MLKTMHITRTRLGLRATPATRTLMRIVIIPIVRTVILRVAMIRRLGSCAPPLPDMARHTAGHAHLLAQRPALHV